MGLKVPGGRGSLGRWVSPDAGSSWAVLWGNAVGWVVLLVLWGGYLVIGDVAGYRRWLLPLLCLVAVVEILTVAAAMIRKRHRPDGTSRSGQDRT
jgi:hypothetical protein